MELSSTIAPEVVISTTFITGNDEKSFEWHYCFSVNIRHILKIGKWRILYLLMIESGIICLYEIDRNVSCTGNLYFMP